MVNIESTERYYQAMRTVILSRAWETALKRLQTWPTSSPAGAKRRTRVTPPDVQEIKSIENRPVKTSRQLQLWEPHPGKVDEPARHKDPIQVVETKPLLLHLRRRRRSDNSNGYIDGWRKAYKTRFRHTGARQQRGDHPSSDLSRYKKGMRDNKVDGTINEPPT